MRKAQTRENSVTREFSCSVSQPGIMEENKGHLLRKMKILIIFLKPGLLEQISQ